MAIKVGDRLPNGTLSEFIEVEKEGCTIGPNTFKVEDMVKGKKIAIKDESGGVAYVTIKDVNQSNGVIHVIDHVALPKM